jgi:magnesium-transporting ATPase (P-type)
MSAAVKRRMTETKQLKPDGASAAALWTFDTCHEGIDNLDKTFNADARFLPNVIRTSKYTCLSFFPYNLFLQFSKPANLYFLIMSVL